MPKCIKFNLKNIVEGTARMNYIYYGFGIRFHSNVPLIGLSDNKINTGVDMIHMIDVSLFVIADPNYVSRNSNYALYSEGDKYILDFGEITYEIQHNHLRVITKYRELFNSTFFNVPLSVLLLINGRLLLHASAFINSGKLIPLCAEKGMGKSTFLAYAYSRKDKVYCDDTLPLVLANGNIYAVNSASFIKLNRDSCEKTGIKDFEKFEKNINKKAYIKAEIDSSSILLDSLYFMSRSKKSIELSCITNTIAARTYIYSNVVGIFWFDPTLNEALRNCELFNKLCLEVKLYKFNFIREWDYLEKNYAVLINHENKIQNNLK